MKAKIKSLIINGYFSFVFRVSSHNTSVIANSMKRLIKIILIILVFGIVTLLVGLTLLNALFVINDKSTNFLNTELNTNLESFNSMAVSILSDTSINYISIQGDNQNRCEAINKWIRCPGDTWTYNNTTKQLASLDQVLRIERIPKTYYNLIVDFMRKHQLKCIQVPFDCETCIDFEASYNGLRYSRSDNISFVTNHEYVIVNKINENWFSYERDTN